MSARKIDSTVFQHSIQPAQHRLTLPANAVRVRKSGIEFRSPQPIAPWTEMTVSLQPMRAAKKVQCAGVVVACNGTSQTGYSVTMLFTNLSRQSQARLSALA